MFTRQPRQPCSLPILACKSCTDTPDQEERCPCPLHRAEGRQDTRNTGRTSRILKQSRIKWFRRPAILSTSLFYIATIFCFCSTLGIATAAPSSPCMCHRRDRLRERPLGEDNGAIRNGEAGEGIGASAAGFDVADAVGST